MRFLTHPLLFYPLALIVAGLIVLIGLEPQRWAREPRPIEAERQGETLVLAGDAFDAPSPSPDQNMKVVRNFWGEAQALRIAVLPGQPEPTPAERGVRILLSPEDAAFIEDRPVVVEVSYDVMTMNTAPALAVSLQGIAPADWVRQDVPAEPGVLRFELPPQFAVDGIGFRAIATNDDQAYGLEITNVRITPRAS